ncbi:MAG: ribonuclease R [Bacteroidetes bacterium]|nr:MAG: ribonuclease R [Bacteroidota bacterium]
MPKHNKKTGNPKNISLSQILRVFNKYPKKSFNYKQLAKQLGVSNLGQRSGLESVLNQMVNKKLLIKPKPGKFQIANPKKSSFTESSSIGVIDMIASGAGYVKFENSDTDVYVPKDKTFHALHGDTVAIHLTHSGNRKPEGRVIKIIKRGNTRYTGILSVSKDFAFLATDSPRMTTDIFIPLNKLNGAKSGHKALVNIETWPEDAKNPTGKVVEIFGMAGDNDAEINAILHGHELPSSFPKNVEAVAAEIDTSIKESEIAKRRDFRKIITFTIDPDDAKDFDDALSIRKIQNGLFEIGVHIADVSHYVVPGSKIDEEAYSRATSIYLVDRVIPMLPEVLSNQVCSLRPNEEKLCFAAVFEMNENAEIKSEWFGKTIISSDRRFTYDEAQERIDNGTGEFNEEVKTLNRLAVKLRKRRFESGSIEFDKVEVKFQLDEAGNPISVIPKVQKASNKLIEEFMLLANKRVAELIGKPANQKKIRPFVYRVHDSPDIDKLKAFQAFIKQFGYEMKLGSREMITASLNAVLKAVKGKPEANLIETLAIRTMAKAVYTTKNIGHYGLSFGHYSHFTSPIRRYPDLIVHRLLEVYLANNSPDNSMILGLEDDCKHCSEQERKAEAAERDSIKYKQVQYLQDRVGHEFTGVISGVTTFGFFVELIENKCEGLVRISSLDDDHYTFDKDNFCLRGRRYKDSYNLGDRVNVIIKSADVIKKQLDFVIA